MKTIDSNRLQIGDVLIRTKGGIFSKHYFVCSGHNPLTGEPEFAENHRIFGVRKASFSEAMQMGKLIDVRYNQFSEFKQLIISERIDTLLGKNYSLASYNCEHFVNDVIYGNPRSMQVQNAAILLALIIFCFVVYRLSSRRLA